MKRYLRIWLKLISNTMQNAFASRMGVIFFTLGKILRFLFFLLFLVILVTRTNTLAGFTLWEVLLFYMTFNLVDILSQGLFREVYRFRFTITTGNFDHFLLKPFSPLFRCLFGGLDILDMITLIPLLGLMLYTGSQISSITLTSFFLYILLIFDSLLISVSFHIFVLGLGVIASEVDNAIWIFRDITYLGRVPIDIYREPIRSLLTFMLPVGIMLTFPTKVLLGVLGIQWVVVSGIFGILILFLCLKFWHFALRKHTSVGG